MSLVVASLLLFECRLSLSVCLSAQCRRQFAVAEAAMGCTMAQPHWSKNRTATALRLGGCIEIFRLWRLITTSVGNHFLLHGSPDAGKSVSCGNYVAVVEEFQFQIYRLRSSCEFLFIQICNFC